MTLYAIRHKTSRELMPQAKARRGYSHWNPAKPDHAFKRRVETPRFFTEAVNARRAIAMWATLPNARSHSYQTYDGEYDNDIVWTPDGRAREDLEVIKFVAREVS